MTTHSSNKPQNLKLQSLEDVVQAKAMNRLLNRPTVSHTMVKADFWNDSEKTAVEQKITKLFNECGCLYAGAAFLCTFCILLVRGYPQTSSLWMDVGLTFFGATLAALIIKLTVLLITHIQLSYQLNKLSALYCEGE